MAITEDDLNRRSDIERVGRDYVQGKGRERQVVAKVTNGGLSLTKQGRALFDAEDNQRKASEPYEPPVKRLDTASVDELATMAKEYGVTLDKRKSITKLREEVRQLTVRHLAPNDGGV